MPNFTSVENSQHPGRGVTQSETTHGECLTMLNKRSFLLQEENVAHWFVNYRFEVLSFGCSHLAYLEPEVNIFG